MIKVGQWVRYLKNDGKLKFKQMCITLNEEDLTIPLENINKVANTPQELLKLYDIVELRNGYTFKIEEIKNKKVYDRLGDRGFELDDITAIYTPNEDKTQYTEQWRKGEYYGN